MGLTHHHRSCGDVSSVAVRGTVAPEVGLRRPAGLHVGEGGDVHQLLLGVQDDLACGVEAAHQSGNLHEL